MPVDFWITLGMLLFALFGWLLRGWLDKPDNSPSLVMKPVKFHLDSLHGLGFKSFDVIGAYHAVADTTGTVTMFNGPEDGNRPRRVFAAIDRWLAHDWPNSWVACGPYSPPVTRQKWSRQ